MPRQPQQHPPIFAGVAAGRISAELGESVDWPKLPQALIIFDIIPMHLVCPR